MGILKSLFTLGKSFISQAEESIEETQGVRMLEQHIRDAKAELDKAGKSRVDLLARVKLSHDKLGNDSNLLIVFYVQIMPDDFVMQLHRF